MDEAAEVALVLARAVAHELGNLLQPLATALRYAQRAPPGEVGPHLEMAAEAVAGCQAIGERLRTAAFSGGERESFSIQEALEEAREGLPAAQQALVRLPGSARHFVCDRGATVLALGQLLGYAAESAGARGAVDVELGEAGGRVVIRYGPPSPSRDDEPLPLEHACAAVRMTTGLAMAWVLSTRALGPGSLRVAQSGGSGRIELGSQED